MHVLCNNAGVAAGSGIDNFSLETWRWVLDVNVMGPALVAKHVVPEMRKAGGGAIVNLGSMSSFIAQPQFVTYNSSKAAIMREPNPHTGRRLSWVALIAIRASRYH